MKYINPEYQVIGLCGYAGSGKDLFYQLLSQKMGDLRREALAAQLKSEMSDDLIKSHNIDIFNCEREEKDSVRHLLVEYGTKKRRKTNGRHWVEKLNKKILPLDQDICVTDIRYAHYENDEHRWLKDELGGVLVWIDLYTTDHGEGARIYNGPPNEEEKINGPLLKEYADFVIEWERVRNIDRLGRYVDEFIGWLHGQRNKGRNPSKQNQKGKMQQEHQGVNRKTF